MGMRQNLVLAARRRNADSYPPHAVQTATNNCHRPARASGLMENDRVSYPRKPSYTMNPRAMASLRSMRGPKRCGGWAR